MFAFFYFVFTFFCFYKAELFAFFVIHIPTKLVALNIYCIKFIVVTAVIMKSIDYKQNTKNVINKSPSVSDKSSSNSRRYLTITLPQPTLYILNCFKFTKSYFSFLSAAAITVKNYDYRFL